MSTSATHRHLEWTWSCDRILVATDGSAPSLAAVGWAARIAEDVPAELSVVYADEIENDRAPTETEASAARARLDRWCADHGAHGFGMRCTARPGNPRSVLRDAIGEENPDWWSSARVAAGASRASCSERSPSG